MPKQTFMSGKTPLGDRMKEFYEFRSQQYLPRRTNILMRLDGVGFSKFTRGLDEPFDASFVQAMDRTAMELCRFIQGAKCAFVQSDEITILICDYDNITTSAWFDNSVQKMVSVAAGKATAVFNREFAHKTKDVDAYFDARVFVIPLAEEVVNCFLWRQQDCTRNSLSTVAQTLYSSSQLHGKNASALNQLIFEKGEELRIIMMDNGTLPEELWEKPNLNWNDLPAGLKRGRLIKRVINTKTDDAGNLVSARSAWVSHPAPLFNIEREAILSLLPSTADEEEEDVALPSSLDKNAE